MRKQVRSTNYLMTLANPDTEAMLYLQGIHQDLCAVYTVGQLEGCPETGTPHIQFFMNFKK